MYGFFSEEQVKTVKRPAGRVRTCASCGRYLLCETPRFASFGEGKKGIVIVLPYPTEMQDSKKDVLFNQNVRYISKIFAKKGIDLARDCTTLFSVACFSPKKVIPLPEHIEACRPRLLAELKSLAPKLIFLFGDASIKSVIGDHWHKDFGKIEKWVGWIIPDQELDAWVCPLDLPDVRLESEEQSTLFHMYLEQGLSKLYEPMPYIKPEFELYTEEQDICKSLRRVNNLAERQYLLMAFDYETTGLKPHNVFKHKIVCMSFSYRWNGEQKTYCIKMPKTDTGKAELKKLLTNPLIGKIAHNMKFEEMWTKNILGYNVTPWVWDSQLAAHILDSRDMVSGLKFQTYVNFGIAGYDDEVSMYLKGVDSKDGNSLNRVLEYIARERNYLTLMKYCAFDSLYTLALAEKQQDTICGEAEE